jgi:poly-gamma-glutamate synthesis protein (capsule biosynthesis protein)
MVTGRHAREQADSLSLFGKEFVIGDGFGYRHEPDPMDLAEILKAIRQGKAHADFLVASVHSHEYAADGFPELPGHFLRDVAHAAIDAGADAFVTSGIHHLGPVEIYRGRPVLYGLGNFFWSDLQEPLPGELYQRNRPALAEAFARPERATDADLSALLNTRSFANELTFETVIAECRFAGGGLAEIRLHPVDLGYGRRLTESGTPRLAGPEQGRRILERVRAASRQFGVPIDIAVEDGVGVIRAVGAG